MTHSFFTDLKYSLCLVSILLIPLFFSVPVAVSLYSSNSFSYILISSRISSCFFYLVFHTFHSYSCMFPIKCQLASFLSFWGGQFLFKNYLGIWIGLQCIWRLICGELTCLQHSRSLFVILPNSFRRVLMFSSHSSYTLFVKLIPRYFMYFHWYCKWLFHFFLTSYLWDIGKLLRFAYWSLDHGFSHLTELL